MVEEEEEQMLIRRKCSLYYTECTETMVEDKEQTLLRLQLKLDII